MSSWIYRREQERQKREKHLQQRVQESLCLSAPDLSKQGCATHNLSSEEQKRIVRQYRSKLRINRIQQVRAQDALLAAQRVLQFRDQKANHSKLLLNQLRDTWRNEQLRCIASLEAEFAETCKSIGGSHDAALVAERDRAAKKELASRQAEESRCWDALRFEEALHQERELRKLRKCADWAPALWRQVVENVSNTERSTAHRYSHGAKLKQRGKQVYGCSQTVNPLVCPDVRLEKVTRKLAAFEDSHLHSRFDDHRGLFDYPSSAVVNFPEQENLDAWRAADARRESVKCEKVHQMELDRLLSERQLERGNAAAAKLVNDKRTAMLEHDVEEAFRQEEREKDRLHAAVNPSFFQRATSAGQRSRIIYNKHKISNPLSCPGLPHSRRTCSRCRSCVELISLPHVPVSEESNPEFNIECESDVDISVR